jgi:ribosomal-protein-alanine N-acetyltransferase
MTGLEFCSVGREQAGVIASLHRECFSEHWQADTISALLSTPGSGAVLAQDTTCEPVAFAVYRCVCDEAEIISIAVTPTRRRRGIATSLWAHLSLVLRQKGAAAVYLEVDESNRKARALYQKLGFKQIGVRKGYYEADNTDALVLCADLT